MPAPSVGLTSVKTGTAAVIEQNPVNNLQHIFRKVLLCSLIPGGFQNCATGAHMCRIWAALCVPRRLSIPGRGESDELDKAGESGEACEPDEACRLDGASELNEPCELGSRLSASSWAGVIS